MERAHKAQLLAGVSAFSGLESEQLALLAAAFAERRCFRGERLMVEGEKGVTLSVIASGAVCVYLSEGGGVARERPG